MTEKMERETGFEPATSSLGNCESIENIRHGAHGTDSCWVCLLYDDGPTPRRIEPLLIFTDVEVPVSIEVAAQV